MTVGSIGYSELNLGLNNQKMALLGLFDRAARGGYPVTLPQLSLFNPLRKQHPTVDLDTIFDGDALNRFAAGFGLDVVPGPPESLLIGWNCFLDGTGCIGRDSRRGLAAINDFVCQFFSHLVPRVTGTEAFAALSDVIFEGLGIQTVIQLRIEKDWAEYSERSLKKTTHEEEDHSPTFLEIISKVSNTSEIPSKLAYVVCDEANLPVGKDEIRRQVFSRYGITLVWKSDFLPAATLARFSILELSLIDFEMAARAPYFIGVSRSTFSDLAMFETFCRRRRPVTTHYIYNLPGEVLGRRADNGSQVLPSLVVNRILAREPLIEHSDDDCLWPATLTAHFSRFGDFLSEGCITQGVRAGDLTCGVRGGDQGHLIEGFSLRLGSGAPVGIEYRTLLADGSWTPWVQNGEYVGTRGASRQICGYAVRLTGPLAGRYQCVCAGSFVGQRDLVVVRDGQDCRGQGGGKMEAMHIVFRPAFEEWSEPLHVRRSGAHGERAAQVKPQQPKVPLSFVKHVVYERGETTSTETPGSEVIDLLAQVRKLRVVGK